MHAEMVTFELKVFRLAGSKRKDKREDEGSSRFGS